MCSGLADITPDTRPETRPEARPEMRPETRAEPSNQLSSGHISGGKENSGSVQYGSFSYPGQGGYQLGQQFQPGHSGGGGQYGEQYCNPPYSQYHQPYTADYHR